MTQSDASRVTTSLFVNNIVPQEIYSQHFKLNATKLENYMTSTDFVQPC